jgi:ankyrin repeat protein
MDGIACCIDTVRCLIEHNADVTCRSDDESTALHLASVNGHSDTVKYLCEHGGVDVEASNETGMTAV